MVTADIPALEIDVERDLVVLALPARQPRLGIPAERAYDVAACLREKALVARAWLEAGGKGTLGFQLRAFGVAGKGETVYVVFDGPTDRLRVPAAAADAMAARIESVAREVCVRLAMEWAVRTVDQRQVDPCLR